MKIRYLDPWGKFGFVSSAWELGCSKGGLNVQLLPSCIWSE